LRSTIEIEDQLSGLGVGCGVVGSFRFFNCGGPSELDDEELESLLPLSESVDSG
jgi:hypothetical protein